MILSIAEISKHVLCVVGSFLQLDDLFQAELVFEPLFLFLVVFEFDSLKSDGFHFCFLWFFLFLFRFFFAELFFVGDVV